MRLRTIAQRWSQREFFGFVEGHRFISEQSLDSIATRVGGSNDAAVSQFEEEFARLVGPGKAVSFAAGRMAFFSLLRVLGIQEGDEVLLLGSTCSVMVNAVLRTGATPIFSDIDTQTMGSSATLIREKLTPKTRVIVAQHSFGIPCDIEPILEVARKTGVFVLEDCALSVGSTIDGRPVGSFGDAAIFSVDHSKPINCMVGGLLFTSDSSLGNAVAEAGAHVPRLPYEKQRALWGRLLTERYYCQPSNLSRLPFRDAPLGIVNNLRRAISPFLDEDYASVRSHGYPYPARLPGFSAEIGLQELRRWPAVAEMRSRNLARLLSVAEECGLRPDLPKAYFNPRLGIVPLRLALSRQDGARIREKIAQFVDVAWTWFMKPIVGTTESLERLGYRYGSCPTAERIGPGMVNFPCNHTAADIEILATKIRLALRGHRRGDA